jgi:ParB-like chromosome segregation protein Spo0J
MEICYLPIESLKVSSDSFLNPLPPGEYEDLRESIAKHGVLEPLIVTSEEDGFYTVRVGNNRLRVAGEIGIKTLPCSIVDITSIEGALDTEIFRRHLSPEERTKYKALKEAKCEEIIRKEMEKKLLPELVERYKKGLISRESAIEVMKLGMEEQTSLFNSLPRPAEAVENAYGISTEDEEVAGSEEEIARLNKILDEKNREIKELKGWKDENKEKIEENLEELKKEKSKASEAVRKEFEKEIKNLMKTNEKLADQIKAKQTEIDRIEEEREKFKRLLSDKEIEIKAEKVLFAEDERKYMINVVIFRLDAVLEEIVKIRGCLKDDLSKKDASAAREKISTIIENSEGLLTLINKKG